MAEEGRGRIVIAGGAGFLGRALLRACEALSYEVVILSRSAKPIPGARVVVWDGLNIAEWKDELDGAVAVVNLSGESVTKKWTDAYKDAIIRSRVNPTRAIGQAIRGCANPPRVWINASATGIYGDAGDQLMAEDSKYANDFLGRTCQAWENAAKEFETERTRLVLLRIGIVLGHGGGAFEEIGKFVRRYLGGALGDGKQWMSWIHLDDLVGLIVWAIESENVRGAYNAVAPSPVQNKDFMYAFRLAIGRPWAPPAPAFALRLMEKMGGVPAEAVLASTRVSSEKALQAGYRFLFPTLNVALANLVPNKEVARQ